ncbi:precorrin-6y C5,15-methyltransferase (decarboxylating) subunit CbiE [Blastochloris tepida]|uniref:Precorrin-6Y methyltransferase n=1 Tax=Blastochloris tepida TaxID=2233851 RepID=A0A348G010_9HYPH|nr:precorrin-6y C5,15-methyltransferase (decarboxylating) subunit CbiE [Blastochloris tepida]BBF92893.1 precorrin-6Y methyltransferase [Blastochloris tepida]
MGGSDGTAGPWLSIIGVNEDGLDGLCPAARALLDAAELVAGGRRHLDLVAALGKPEFVWDVPFSASIPKLLAHRGTRVVVLASGDPFWFGAGAALSRHVPAADMRVVPAPSTFSLAAARLGWRIEETATLGLHARPLEALRPHLAPGVRLIVLVRDGAAPAQLAGYLAGLGFGPSRLHVLEALGGPRERVRTSTASAFDVTEINAPVAVAIEAEAGPEASILPATPGLPDELFENDGQLTKREIRALTLASLAPHPGELLWDIGAGAGSIGIEWLLAHPANRAIGIESSADRLVRAQRNALTLGVPQFDLRLGEAPAALAGLPAPDAVFIGGGANDAGVIEAAWAALRPGGRLVVNAVTLETEAKAMAWQARVGGALTRIAIERAGPVGSFTAWRPALPVVQWVARR